MLSLSTDDLNAVSASFWSEQTFTKLSAAQNNSRQDDAEVKYNEHEA